MYEYRCRVNKVLDGDTVDIDLDLGFNIILSSQRMRMAGVDTPESRTSDKEEKPRGLLSKKVLSEKLPIGSWIKIRTMNPNNNDDKFGRILGEFILDDGVNVNAWLIENHYAVPYIGENKVLVRDQHQANKKILIARGELKE